jgi:hypothetical protein
MGLGQLLAMSDIRLKANIRHLRDVEGLGVYRWDWNEAANALGLHGTSDGFLAHQVYDLVPDAVHVTLETGEPLLMLDYAKLPEIH